MSYTPPPIKRQKQLITLSFSTSLPTPKMIEEVIEINASPEKVRQTFLDFNSYSEWSKFIVKVISEKPNGESLENGDRLVVTLDVGSKMDMNPKVLKNDKNVFQWIGTLGITGIFDGTHTFQFEKIDDNKTRLVQTENFAGILTYPILWYIGAKTKNGFKEFNESSKKRVESSQSDE